MALRETANNRDIGGFSRSRDGGDLEGPVDALIAGLAERQYGVVARSQLLALGLGEDGLQHRLTHGRLHLLHQGTYAVGHRDLPREGRWMAAVLATGPDAVLSHWSAAALWMVKDGIPVTSVPRTIFDLAATEDVDTVAAMLRESEHLNLSDRLSLPDLVDRYPGRRGVTRVRLALQRITEERGTEG